MINIFIFHLGKTAKLCERHFAECCYVKSRLIAIRHTEQAAEKTTFEAWFSPNNISGLPFLHELSLMTSAANRNAREEDNLNCSI